MRDLGLSLVILLTAVGCASTRGARPDAMRAACEADMASDARCVDVLTRPQGGYEAEAEVRAAEQARERGAFQDRLAKMRADHEARIAAKIRTSSTTLAAPGGPKVAVPVAPEVEVEPEDDDELEKELDLVIKADTVDTGSSVRAMTAAPPPPPPVKAPPPAPALPATFGPTPEQWLRAARCVFVEDVAALKARAAALGKAGDRAGAGAVALVVLDAQALEARVQAEVAHRKLAKDGPVCSSSGLKGATRHLRSMLGDVPGSGGHADRYGQGLAKVARTLEIRAGLPRGQ